MVCCVLTKQLALSTAGLATRHEYSRKCMSSSDIRGRARWQHEGQQRHPGAPDSTNESPGERHVVWDRGSR
eukprot:6186343-Pleurochrysis_carterae.AAC.2